MPTLCGILDFHTADIFVNPDGLLQVADVWMCPDATTGNPSMLPAPLRQGGPARCEMLETWRKEELAVMVNCHVAASVLTMLWLGEAWPADVLQCHQPVEAMIQLPPCLEKLHQGDSSWLQPAVQEMQQSLMCLTVA